MKNLIRFKGHESFIIREGWLNKGLQEVEGNPKLFYENYGADELGVGPNMAKSIRFWLRCSGFIDERTRNEVRLSSLGKLIWEKDPYFENMFSLWLVHCNIVRNQEQATAWKIFFDQFDYEEFTREEMEREVLSAAKQMAGEQKFSEKSVLDDCEAILRMYSKKRTRNNNPEEKNISPFGSLGLLKYSGGIYKKEQPLLNCIPPEIVLYLLLDLMKPGEGRNIDELLRVPGGPGKVLNLKRTGLVELLENLESKEKIVLNRTAGLDMVYLPEHTTEESVLKDYYK